MREVFPLPACSAEAMRLFALYFAWKTRIDILTRLSLHFIARSTCGLSMAILCAHVAQSHVN